MESPDANLLVALDALFQAGSVTAAARRMNVSPPAMSHTLARLRLAVGDPLFVRAGNRLVPTPRAVAMQSRVSRAASEIGALLRPDLPLDVATLERTFIIRASDAIIVTVGHALDALGAHADALNAAEADGTEVLIQAPDLAASPPQLHFDAARDVFRSTAQIALLAGQAALQAEQVVP